MDGPDLPSVTCGRMVNRLCRGVRVPRRVFAPAQTVCWLAAATVGWTRLVAVGAYAFAPEASFEVREQRVGQHRLGDCFCCAGTVNRDRGVCSVWDTSAVVVG